VLFSAFVFYRHNSSEDYSGKQSYAMDSDFGQLSSQLVTDCGSCGKQV